jgi:pantoate kinase
MRLVAGGPGTGMVEQIPVDEQDRYKAAILSIAPISTKEFLSSRIDRIDGLGAKMLGRLQKTKSINEFLKMSYEFAYALGLTEGRCSPPIRALKEAGFDCSVALFGQTVFTIVAEEQIRKVKEIMQKFEGTLLVCGIDCNGARLIK